MITEYKISDGELDISISIIRSKRKSIGLEVRPDGCVLARIPARLSDRELKKFLDGHKEWVFQKKKLLEDRQKSRETSSALPVRELTPEDMEKIKAKFLERVQYFSGLMEVTYGKFTIRSQKTRWGSCSGKGNLNFNYQLYYLTEKLLDYVVVHELAHRIHMNHSPAFWKEVEKYCPDHKECRRKLRAVEIG